MRGTDRTAEPDSTHGKRRRKQRVWLRVSRDRLPSCALLGLLSTRGESTVHYASVPLAATYRGQPMMQARQQRRARKRPRAPGPLDGRPFSAVSICLQGTLRVARSRQELDGLWRQAPPHATRTDTAEST
eukprot:7993063-Lingulodinium_polyedra.AAC.1